MYESLTDGLFDVVFLRNASNRKIIRNHEALHQIFNIDLVFNHLRKMRFKSIVFVHNENVYVNLYITVAR